MFKGMIAGGCVSLVLAACAGAPSRDVAAPVVDRVREHVRAMDTDRATRYASADIDLDSDGTPETLVYLQGPAWCGSGGCTLLVLQRNEDGLQEIGRVPVARLPVRVLPSISHGWHDLGVMVQGGGVRKAHEEVLKFDGARFPYTPVVVPPDGIELSPRFEPEVVIGKGARTQSVW